MTQSCMRFAFLFLLFSSPFLAAKPISQGIWSWSQSAFDSAKGRQQLIAFCSSENISRVDQHLSIRLHNGQRQLENQAELRKLLKSAHPQISINALRGDKKMFFAVNHQRTLKDLQLVISFNQSQPKKQRLSGMKYDVEPYLTEEWKRSASARKKVMLDYLHCLVKIKKALKESRSSMKLHVDVPFWWDKPEHTLSFQNKTQPFTHHIQDLTDAISIMSYRRDAHKIIALSAAELDYANKIGKTNSVSVGVETIKINGSESFISFHGLPAIKFRNTVRQLHSTLKTNRASSGVMIHEYRSLQAYLKK